MLLHTSSEVYCSVANGFTSYDVCRSILNVKSIKSKFLQHALFCHVCDCSLLFYCYSRIFLLRETFSPRVLPIISYTGRFRPKGVPFSGFRYISERVGISQAQVCERVGKSVI